MRATEAKAKLPYASVDPKLFGYAPIFSIAIAYGLLHNQPATPS